MKRYNYGLNCSTFTGTDFPYMTPLNHIEVVPGDTIGGEISVRYQSDNTVSLVMNRAYFDLYAVYVPYRVLWDDFPTYLIEGTGTVPTVANGFDFNFIRIVTGKQIEICSVHYQRDSII